MAEPSITPEDFENKYMPLLNAAAELIMGHPEIPDEIDQADVLSGILLLQGELKNSLHNRVPEIVKLQDEVASLKKQNTKLQDTNHKLFLEVGKAPSPAKDEDDNKPVKKSFEEIKRMIESL